MRYLRVQGEILESSRRSGSSICLYYHCCIKSKQLVVFFVCTQSLHVDQRRESESFQFCRVVLPDHSSTILLCKEGQTLRQALIQLCERRHLSFVAHEVFLGGGDKVAVMTQCNDYLISSMSLVLIEFLFISISLLCVD